MTIKNLFAMQVICLDEPAFYALIEEVVKRIKDKENVQSDKWISGEEAMQMLRITSKTTLQKLRDEGKICFSQRDKKMILYDSKSIDQYIEQHMKSVLDRK